MKISYHPGRRKRRQVMDDLAWGIAFQHILGFDEEGKPKRLSYTQRFALEAVFEASYAFENEANLQRCKEAVVIALSLKDTKSAQRIIKSLETDNLVIFKQKTAGKCVDIPDATIQAFRTLETMERLIAKVNLADGGNTEIDITETIEHLQEYRVHYAKTDDQQDADMRTAVNDALKKRKNKAQNTNGKPLMKTAVMTAAAILLSAVLVLNAGGGSDVLASIAFDKAGTVGL